MLPVVRRSKWGTKPAPAPAAEPVPAPAAEPAPAPPAPPQEPIMAEPVEQVEERSRLQAEARRDLSPLYDKGIEMVRSALEIEPERAERMLIGSMRKLQDQRTQDLIRSMPVWDEAIRAKAQMETGKKYDSLNQLIKDYEYDLKATRAVAATAERAVGQTSPDVVGQVYGQVAMAPGEERRIATVPQYGTTTPQHKEAIKAIVAQHHTNPQGQLLAASTAMQSTGVDQTYRRFLTMTREQRNALGIREGTIQAFSPLDGIGRQGDLKIPLDRTADGRFGVNRAASFDALRIGHFDLMLERSSRDALSLSEEEWRTFDSESRDRAERDLQAVLQSGYGALLIQGTPEETLEDIRWYPQALRPLRAAFSRPERGVVEGVADPEVLHGRSFLSILDGVIGKMIGSWSNSDAEWGSDEHIRYELSEYSYEQDIMIGGGKWGAKWIANGLGVPGLAENKGLQRAAGLVIGLPAIVLDPDPFTVGVAGVSRVGKVAKLAGLGRLAGKASLMESGERLSKQLLDRMANGESFEDALHAYRLENPEGAVVIENIVRQRAANEILDSDLGWPKWREINVRTVEALLKTEPEIAKAAEFGNQRVAAAIADETVKIEQINKAYLQEVDKLRAASVERRTGRLAKVEETRASELLEADEALQARIEKLREEYILKMAEARKAADVKAAKAMAEADEALDTLMIARLLRETDPELLLDLVIDHAESIARGTKAKESMGNLTAAQQRLVNAMGVRWADKIQEADRIEAALAEAIGKAEGYESIEQARETLVNSMGVLERVAKSKRTARAAEVEAGAKSKVVRSVHITRMYERLRFLNNKLAGMDLLKAAEAAPVKEAVEVAKAAKRVAEDRGLKKAVALEEKLLGQEQKAAKARERLKAKAEEAWEAREAHMRALRAELDYQAKGTRVREAGEAKAGRIEEKAAKATERVESVEARKAARGEAGAVKKATKESGKVVRGTEKELKEPYKAIKLGGVAEPTFERIREIQRTAVEDVAEGYGLARIALDEGTEAAEAAARAGADAAGADAYIAAVRAGGAHPADILQAAFAARTAAASRAGAAGMLIRLADDPYIKHGWGSWRHVVQHVHQTIAWLKSFDPLVGAFGDAFAPNVQVVARRTMQLQDEGSLYIGRLGELNKDSDEGFRVALMQLLSGEPVKIGDQVSIFSKNVQDASPWENFLDHVLADVEATKKGENFAFEAFIRAWLPPMESGTTFVGIARKQALSTATRAAKEEGALIDEMRLILLNKARSRAGMEEFIESIEKLTASKGYERTEAPRRALAITARAIMHGNAMAWLARELRKYALPNFTPEQANAMNVWLNRMQTGEKAGVTLEEGATVEQAWAGFAAWGMRAYGDKLPKEVILERNEITRQMRRISSTDESMVTHIPEPLIKALEQNTGRIKKEIQTVPTGKEPLRVAADFIKAWTAFDRYAMVVGWPIPKVGRYAMTAWSEGGQMADLVGIPRALGAQLKTLPEYIPLLGDARRKYGAALRAKTGGKPLIGSMTEALTDPVVEKVFSQSEDLIRVAEGNISGARLFREAIEDGIRDNIIMEDVLSLMKRDSSSRVMQALYKTGDIVGGMNRLNSRFFEKTQMMQRSKLYLDARASGMSRLKARELLKEAHFDWKFSSSRAEMASLGVLVPFWNARRNGMRMHVMALLEQFTLSTPELLKRTALGQTRLARRVQQVRMIKAMPEFFWWDNPDAIIDDIEQRVQGLKHVFPSWAKNEVVLYQDVVPDSVRERRKKESGRDLSHELVTMPVNEALQGVMLHFAIQQIAVGGAYELAGGEGLVEGWWDEVLDQVADTFDAPLLDIFLAFKENPDDLAYVRPEEYIFAKNLGFSDDFAHLVRGSPRMHKGLLGLYRSMPALSTSIAPTLKAVLNDRWQDGYKAGMLEMTRDLSRIAKTTPTDPQGTLERELKHKQSMLKGLRREQGGELDPGD